MQFGPAEHNAIQIWVKAIMFICTYGYSLVFSHAFSETLPCYLHYIYSYGAGDGNANYFFKGDISFCIWKQTYWCNCAVSEAAGSVFLLGHGCFSVDLQWQLNASVLMTEREF